MRAEVRGLATGVALGFAASSALAAELPKPAPDLPPSLGTCGLASGFMLPGTNACLTVGGLVRANGTWRLATTPRFAGAVGAARHPEGETDRLDRSTLGASARLTADMRMPTEAGPMRVFVSLRGRKDPAMDRAAR